MVVLFVIFFTLFFPHIPYTLLCSNKCNTMSYASIVDQITQLVNLEVDPCSDFNKFACGGFENMAHLEGPNDFKTTMSIPVQKLKNRIEDLIKIKPNRPNDFKTDQKVRDFYTACVSWQDALNKNQYEEDWTRYMSYVLSPYITEIMNNVGLGDWPYSDNSELNQSFLWLDIVPRLIKEGAVYTDGVLELPIINVEVGLDDFTRNKYRLRLDSPDFDIDHNKGGKNLCSKETNGTQCNINLETIMDIINPDQPAINTMLLNRSLQIDLALYKITKFPELARYGYSSKHLKTKKLRDYGDKDLAEVLRYRKTAISDLPKLTCGTFDTNCTAPTWVEYFQYLVDASGNPHIKIKDTQKVIVKDVLYLEKLQHTLENLNIRRFEMANYLGWKIVSDIILVSRNLKYEFQENCVNFLMKGRSSNRRSELGLLNGAVGSMYVREYFNPKWKSQVQEMVTYVRKVAKLFIEKTTMMSSQSKRKALEKLAKMKEFIAYPEEMLSQSIIDEYYKDLTISNDNHAENIKAIAKFLIKKSFGRIGTKRKSDSWDLEFHQLVNTVNAHYERELNEFVIPAGYLQEFNYAYSHPMYLNFAITGYTVGHEILHAFDNIGRFFDLNGESLDGEGIWSDDTSVRWNEYSECIIHTYSNLVINLQSKQHHINGKNTLGENIADIGGIRLAYYAYVLWAKKYGKECIPPGLPFSARQLFWIRSAQLHCAKLGVNVLTELLEKDHYTPGGYRTNGYIMFSDEFAKDFNCPKNTPMNPTKNCTIKSFWPSNPLSEKGLSKDSLKSCSNSQTFFILSSGLKIQSRACIHIFFTVFILTYNLVMNPVC